MKISTGTITRTVILALALINQVITVSGHSPLPIEEEADTEQIATSATIITATIAWYKNNSFSQEAIKADAKLKELKAVK